MLIESNTNNNFFFIEDPEVQFVQFRVYVLYQVDILNVKNNLSRVQCCIFGVRYWTLHWEKTEFEFL